jgi:hypothetical protein
MKKQPRKEGSHWRIEDIAADLNVSEQTATREFENVPGVVILGEQQSTRSKRKYRTILVPDSVYRDYLRSMTVGMGLGRKRAD